MASGGYPDAYVTGKPIIGLDAVSSQATVFHAGTSASNGVVQTSGGRVLSVSALGDSIESARITAYDGVAAITFEDAFNRTDIAKI